MLGVLNLKKNVLSPFKWRHDTQYNNVQNNDVQDNDTMRKDTQHNDV